MTGHSVKGGMLGLAVIMTLAPVASAGGINLFWDECGVGGTNKDFACDSNAGTNDLFVSFDPPATLPLLVGSNVFIDLQSASTPLPAWWQFKNAGACRATSLSGFAGLATLPGKCVDPFQASGTAGIHSYLVTANTPSLPLNRARVIGSVSFAGAMAIQVDPGTEYFSMRIRIDNSKSVGMGSCDGCLDPVCIVLNAVNIYQPPGTPPGNPIVTNPLTNNHVTWQGGAVGGPGCPGATPTTNRTWGAVKSLYR